jgi:hypothetical protein
VRGADRRTQREVRVAPVKLGPGEGTATLVFELATDLAEATKLESASVRLSVMRDNGLPLLVRTFALPKRWQVAIRPENVVFNVTAAPIGKAADLRPEDPHLVLPPRIRTLPRTLVSPDVVSPSVTMRPAAETMSSRRMAILTAPAPGAAASDTQPAAPPAAPASTADRQAVRMRTTEVRAQLPTAVRLAEISNFKYGIKDEDRALNAIGPGATPIDLLEGLRAEADLQLSATKILKIFPDVYQDQHPNSGIFYFRPAGYSLDWTPDAGYGMRMLYSGASGEGGAGEVLMAARLNAGVDTGTLDLARALLQAYKNRHPGVAFNALRPLPIDSADVSLSVGLRAYNIPPEKIAIVALSDVLGQIDMSWITDTTTKDFIQVALSEDVGINGAVTFKPTGNGLAAPQVPVRILLADPDTFGEFRWRRGERWRNETAYPVKLRYLHMLLLEGNEPIIYSWNLGNVEVPPRAQVNWDDGRVPRWLDGRALRTWLDYSVVASCAPCDEQVLSSITGGVSSRSASQITFRTLTPLADTGGYEIDVMVRSRYFDPKAAEVQQKPVLVLNADNKDFTLGPIYTPAIDPSAASAETLFEYFIELTMPDGTVHRATRWLPATGLRVVIGKSQLEQALGSLPPRPGGPGEQTPQ